MVLAGPFVSLAFRRTCGRIRPLHCCESQMSAREMRKELPLGYELLKRSVEIVGQRLEATRFRLLDLYSAEVQSEESLGKFFP